MLEGQLALDRMQVCATDAAGGNAHEQLNVAQRRHGNVREFERAAVDGLRRTEKTRFHHGSRRLSFLNFELSIRS